MRLSLQLVALAYLFFAVFNIEKRPGFFVAALLSSFGLAAFYGPLGALTSLVALLVCGHVWLAKNQPFVPVPGELPLLCWATLTVLSAFVSWELSQSVQQVESLFFLCGSAYAVGRTFGARSEFTRDVFLGSCVILIVTLPMLALAQNTVGRLGGDEQNPVGLASIAEVPMVGALAVIFFDRGRGIQVKVLIVAILLLVIVPFSLAIGTRSLMVSGVAVVVLFLTIRMMHGSVARALAWTAGLAGIVTGTIMLFWSQFVQTQFGTVMQFGLNRMLLLVLHPELGDASSQVRLAAYSDAQDLILSSPLLGHGLGSFYYLADNSGGAYVHNIFLEIAVDTGVVGLLFFLVALIRFGFFALGEAVKRASWENMFILGILLNAILRHQVSLSVTFGKLLFFSFGLIAAQMQMSSAFPWLVLPGKSEENDDPAATASL